MTPDGAADPALVALPLGVWVIGPDGRLVFANAATRQVTGIDPAETPPGLPVTELVRRYAYRGVYGTGDPDSLAAAHLAIDRSRPFRRQFRRGDGASFEQLGAPLPGGGYVAVVVELTGHLALAQEAQERARRLENLLAHLRGGVAAYDPQRCMLFNNPAYEDLLDLPRGTLRPGTSYETLFRLLAERGDFANTDAAAVVEDRRRIDRTRPITYQRIRPNGQALRIESQPLPEGGYLVELNDITAVKQAEDEARRRAALLDGVLASLPHGVVVYGPDGRVARVNAAHQAIMAGAELAVGEHREEITRRRAAQGEYGPGDPETLAAQHLNAPPRHLAPAQRIRPDGTVLDIRYAALPDGGTVQVTTDITALHAARAEATGRAAQLQVMLDNMRHGIALYDAEMRLVVSNALAARLNGLPTDAMRPGRHIHDLVREQAARGVFGEPDQAAQVVAKALTTDRRQPGHWTRHRPDGTVVEVVTDPTPDGGYVVTFSDVTARAMAEEAARAQAAMLQVALDSMRHGFILHDAEGRVVTANAIAATCCGLAPGDIAPGQSLEHVLRLQRDAGVYGTGPTAEATFHELLRLDRGQPFETRRQLPDGRVMEVRTAPTPAGGFVVTLTDITARAQAEAKAEQRATVLQTALESMHHGFLLYDAEARLVAANSLGASYSSLQPEDMVPGRSLASLLQAQRMAGAFGPEPEAAAREASLVVLDRSLPQEYHRTMPDGRILEIRTAPTAAGGFVITQTDITALAQAEAAARDRANLLQAMLDNMRHGIVVFGPDHRVLAANELCSTLAGMAPGTVRPGRGMPELVAARVAANGPFEPAAAAAAVAEDMGLDRRLPHRRERPTAHGRMVSVASDPLPDGGFVISYVDTTEVNAAKAEAQHRALLLQTMQDSMRHGIALFGPDQRLIVANRLAPVLAGVPVAELVPGVTPADIAQWQLRHGVFGAGPAAEAEALAVARRDRSRSYPVRRRMPDGRVVDSVSDPTPNGGFVITWTDVTAQVAAETAAAERTATLQAMIDTMHHGVVLFGPDHRFIADNRLARELTGVPDAMAQPGADFATVTTALFRAGATGDAALDAQMGQMAVKADRSRPLHYIRPMRDGRTLEVFSDPMPDGGFVITMSDITPLARAEAEAKQRAATQAVMLDVIRHGIALFGPDRRLVASNRLAAELSGVSMEELGTGLRFEDAVHYQYAAGILGPGAEGAAVRDELLRADRSQMLRHHRRTPEGRLIEVVSDPTPDGGFAITYSDITALAAAEAAAASRASILQAALDNMRHGLMLFGPDRRLLTANRLAGPDYGLPDLQGREGVAFEILVAEQAEAAEFGGEAAAAALREKVLSLDRSHPSRFRRRRANGRVIEVGSDPTPDGGFVITHTDVTELAQAQDEASARAAMLQRTLDNMRHGIAHFDRDGRLVTANRLAAEFNGIDPALIQPGVHARDLALASLRAGVVTPEVVQAGLADDYSRPQRRTRTQPDGRVIEIFTDPTPDGGFVATYSDVTALTQAEAAARERAGILQVMLDNLRHGIQLFDADHRLVAANRLAADLAGYSAEQLQPGRPLSELIDAQRRAGAIPSDLMTARTRVHPIDRTRPARYTRPHRDGRIIEVTSDPTPGGGFVITMADISALAEAEQAAQHRTALLQAMLDNSRTGIILFDMEGRILAANGIAAGLNGLPPGQVQPGATVQSLILAQAGLGYFDAAEREEALSLVPQDRPWPTPYTRRRTLGHNRIVEVTTDGVGGVGYIRSYRDISEELQARAELERAKDAAEAANKAKSRFLATMSHELRTPLNAVIGFSEAITADPDPVRGKEYVRSIHEAGRHLLSLIDDILDVTRAETIGFATTEGEVPPLPLLEGVVRVMQATAATAGVAVVQALPPALPRLRADELRLRQVLLNLVSNAVKFTPPGGLVTLSAEVPAEGGLVMRVADSGIGIRPEDIPRAFEPFTQLDSSLSRRFPGSGLGLYLSRALAEAQGATLTLESLPGAGTTAVLRFPQSRLIAPLAA